MRRFFLLAAIFAIGVALVPASVAADKPTTGHFSVGASLPQGNAREFLEDGWAIHGGATWWSPNNSALGLRLDVGYDWWDAKSSALATIDTDPSTPLTIDPPDDGSGSVWSGTADLMWNPKTNGKVGFYLLGGVGVYYASWDISETGYGVGYWCDWWWGVCYPYGTTGLYTINSGSSWEWGLNAGVGMTFQMQSGQLYLEGVYHWVDTESSAEFVPISIGYRW